jgi:murein DD-endopeptidase MepM/ murein hydrolase activator NlpD
MIFPELKNKKFGYINLNFEAKEWIASQGISFDTNPLLEPVICQRMVSEVQEKFGVDFSYGGWMEDRGFLWHGSYLDKLKNYVHLGIDINVPSGTKIATDFDAEVVRIDDDYPEDGGWGPRVILKHTSKPIYLIFAHLDREISCKVGDQLKNGSIFAKVGKAPFNGNWFPHLHLQVISEEYFNQLEKNNLWGKLDGYGLSEEIKENSLRFPDPMQYVLLLDYNQSALN